MKKSSARSAAAMLALAGLVAAAPAMAFTRHPETPAEAGQTRQLNLQSLQQAQGQAPSSMQANLGSQSTQQDMQGAPSDMNAPAADNSAQKPMSSDEPSQPAGETQTPDQNPNGQ